MSNMQKIIRLHVFVASNNMTFQLENGKQKYVQRKSFKDVYMQVM